MYSVVNDLFGSRGYWPGIAVVLTTSVLLLGGCTRLRDFPAAFGSSTVAPARAWQETAPVGTAAWIDAGLSGGLTANGERHDARMLVAAHPTLPLPSYARVDNLETGRSLVVRVNDRLPAARGRVVAVSRRSAELLGFRRAGLARVRVEPLGQAPRSGDQSYERHFLASQSWARCRTVGAVEAVACVTADVERPRPVWRARPVPLLAFTPPEWPDY